MNLPSQACHLYQQINPMSRIIFQAVKEPARLLPITDIWYLFFSLRAMSHLLGLAKAFP
jgi:hypothetical protein